MTAAATLTDRPLTDRARDVLKRAGNPFRNYFARNPDDEVCARYHVPELFAPERDLLHAIIDLYRTALWPEEFPGWGYLGLSAAVSLVLLVVGSLVFRRLEGAVLKEI